DGVLQRQDLAFHFDGDLGGEVASGDGRGHVGDVAHLTRQVRGHRVDVVREVLPRAGYALHDGLATELPLGPDLARHTAHLTGERATLRSYRLDGVLQLEDLAADVDGDLVGQIAIGDGGRDFGDVADLAGQVRRHRVDVVRE